MRRGGEGTRADEERGGATLPGSGRRADRCAWPEGECPQTTDPAPPTGLISPKNVQIGYKGLSLRRPHERKPWNHAVVFRPDECDPSLCIRFGHPRLLPGSCAGSQRRSMGASPPEGPRATRSVRRAGGLDRGPGPMVTLLRRSVRRACGHAPGLEPLARRGMPVPLPVASVLRVLLRDRGQAGAGLIEPGLAALSQGLAALPQGQGVLQGDGARL